MIAFKTLPALAGVVLFLGACAPPSGSGAAASSAVPSRPSSAPPPPGVGIYAEPQADRGRSVFLDVCAECHYASEFRNQKFQFKWRRRSVRDLYRDIVRNMPEDDPGSLADKEYVDIVAYILQLNGFPAGDAELPADEAVLAGYSLTPPAPGATR